MSGDDHPAHSPTEFERLLLHAALGDEVECREAWGRARAAVGDADTLDHASYRLMPLLYRNLAAHGVEDPRLGVLKGIYRHAWYLNQRRFHTAAGMLARMQAEGIETVVLKGAALGALYYRDLGVRPVWDVDVLVRRADVPHAAQVLLAAGWTPPARERRSLEHMLRFRHAKLYESPDCGGIDLHWYPLSEPVPVDDLWDSAIPVVVGGVETRALCPADELLVACVHGLGRYAAPVRWISDAATVARAGEVDWDWLVARAQQWRVTARLELALRILRTEFAVAIPDDVLARLPAVRRAYHERLAHQALVRRPRRGVSTIVEWDRYRRLRELDSGAAPAGFGRYLRELTDAPSWPRFFAQYRRRSPAVFSPR